MSGMLSRPDSPVIAAVDIGTTKVCVVIAQRDENGDVTVTGVGNYPSYGLKKGVIVNIQSTVESIKRAVREAELMAGVSLDGAVIGISGSHIKSFDSAGVVGVRDRDVTQHDVDRVIEIAKAIPLEQGREILHVLPQHFRVDGQEFVQDSLGMHGIRLEAQVHIVTGAVSSAQNCIRSCELAGISAEDIILEQLASAEAVLTPTERELGVGILDIGGGTADFAVYKNNAVRYSKVFPIAGNHFTNDIAIGLGIPLQQAEELKKKYGAVTQEAYDQMGVKSVSIPLDYAGGSKDIIVSALLHILQPRAEEIFAFLKDEIDKNRLAGSMPSGLVITGGGALLRGLTDYVEVSCGMPVRIGVPRYYFTEHANGVVPPALQSPAYATAYGLLAFAGKEDRHYYHTGVHEAPLISRVVQRMRTWIHGFW